MTRRNIVANPLPVETDGWSAVAVNTTLTSLVNDDPDLHYTGTVTAASASAYVIWDETMPIKIRPGERYAFSVTNIDVIARPSVGFMRPILLWKTTVGGLPIAADFGADNLSVGGHGEDEATIIAVAPEAALYVVPAFGFISEATGTTGAVEFTVGKFLIEPLGPVDELVEGAIINMIPEPSLEYGTFGWIDHAIQFPDMTDQVWERSTDWSRSGDYSMHTAGRAGTTTYAENIKGVAGSYVLGFAFCEPGEEFTFQAWINNASVLPEGSPGIFLEMFFFYFDGNPSNTVEILHLNSDSIYTPTPLGERFLSVTGTCPEGATIIQVLSVGATNTTGSLIDFYTDDCLLYRGGETVNYFDGDSVGAGWRGIPGASESAYPSRDWRVHGSYFDGDMVDCQWEGEPYASMSSVQLPEMLSAVYDGPIEDIAHVYERMTSA